MAARYLITLTGDIAWNSTTHWSATPGGAGGASFPVTGDTAYMLLGNARFTSGLDQSAQSTNLVIGFNGGMGTESASFQIGSSTITCNPGSNAKIYLASAGTTNLQMFTGTNASVTLTSGDSWSIDSGGGTLTIGAGCTGSALTTYGTAQVLASQSTSTGNDWDAITMVGGYIVWGQPLDNAGFILTMYGGTFVNNAPPTASVTAIASVLLFTNGSTYYHNTGQTLTFIAASDGIATASGATLPFTVTNSTRIASGQVFPNPPVTITYTNPTTKSLAN